MSWGFQSHVQLTEAGYIWRGESVCQACRSKILWYTNPDRRRVPVDPKTYAIHFATCHVRKNIRAQKKAVVKFPTGGHIQRKIDFSGGDDAA